MSSLAALYSDVWSASKGEISVDPLEEVPEGAALKAQPQQKLGALLATWGHREEDAV